MLHVLLPSAACRCFEFRDGRRCPLRIQISFAFCDHHWGCPFVVACEPSWYACRPPNARQQDPFLHSHALADALLLVFFAASFQSRNRCRKYLHQQLQGRFSEVRGAVKGWGRAQMKARSTPIRVNHTKTRTCTATTTTSRCLYHTNFEVLRTTGTTFTAANDRKTKSWRHTGNTRCGLWMGSTVVENELHYTCTRLQVLHDTHKPPAGPLRRTTHNTHENDVRRRCTNPADPYTGQLVGMS